MKELLRGLISDALAMASEQGALELSEIPVVEVEVPRDSSHGDLSSNVAMTLARVVGKPPRAIAKIIVDCISDEGGDLAEKEIAGPGFLNFTFSNEAWRRRLLSIIEVGETYGSSGLGKGRRVQIEFVSANPTGPLHIGHGRGAATGDALARLLETAGYEVDREYYVNDAGVQITNLGRSVYARYLELHGREVQFPPDGYPGDYVIDIARRIVAEEGAAWLDREEEEAVAHMGETGGRAMLERIKEDLAAFSIRFDGFTSEKALRESGAVAEAIADLRSRGVMYEADGAEWFRSTEFGDDKDRTVVKSDGELTYFASDICYHRAKLARGYDRIVDVWGADHHGYIKRIKACLAALDCDPHAFSVVLVQIVSLTRDGRPVRMGKRSGEFVSLREIIDEVGPDLARFFFLMRKSDAQLEFDLELARRQTAENPVFYIQYAHTRIAGIFRQASERGIPEPEISAVCVSRLGNADELSLIRLLDEFPDLVEASARALEPHRVVFYAQRLAGEFHRFYARNKCVSDDRELTAARLLLVKAVKQVIGRALSMVGVSAPERM